MTGRYDFPSRSGKSPRKSRVPRDTPFAVAKAWSSTVTEFLMKFDNLYDSEMMNQNNKSIESLQLPRRTRFYQSAIDTDHLNKNASYKSLPDSTILFICTFDPFGKALAKYTFQAKCLEDDELYLNDGTERIFCNCTYQGNDIPEELRLFYEYMQSGKAGSDLTRRIDNAVVSAKKREEWKSEYMKERALLMDIREEGREEGREEVREEDRIYIERERERANKADERANKADERANKADERASKADERASKAEAQLARYIMTFGELKDS